VILALHGFNDHGRFFDAPGTWLAARGVTSYAYDQRGFGASSNRGVWPGTDTLVRDVREAAGAIRRRHPETPFFVLGESMGGAVALVAAATDGGLPADGLILSAPAVRGRATMSVLERSGLWLSARTVPGLTVSGRSTLWMRRKRPPPGSARQH
jgi:alpha-beta hydrolase superfamily lysophospholipase